MKKFTTVAFFVLVLTACKDSPTSEIPADTVDDVVISNQLQIGCYTYTQDGTDISFKISQNSPTVVGDLNIMLKEKDRNSGKFEGNLQGDKLIGTYTFNSEGVESKRQMAYQFKNNQLIEGYGDMDESGTSFKDTSAIKYTSAMPLIKGDCKE